MIFSIIKILKRIIVSITLFCTLSLVSTNPLCADIATLSAAPSNRGIKSTRFPIFRENKEPKTIEGHQPIVEPKPFILLCSIWGMGFFGDFLTALGALHLYEQGKCSGVSIEYGASGTYYDSEKGPNWWEYYFEPIHVGSRENAPIVPSIQTAMIGSVNYDFPRIVEFTVYRKDANALIKKYVRVKWHIKKKLKQIVKNSFGRSKVIGVHYRGTDKIYEDPLAPFENVAAEVDKAIVQFETDKEAKVKIFVATDQQNFLDYMIERYPSKVIYYQEGARSLNHNAVHTSAIATPYKKGEDALIDCLLLSKSDIIIKTSSNLSLCSAYFNPDIPMVHVTSRYWHPPLE